MADITGASLGPIYERLNSAPTYHPLEADTFADWSLEAGDIVTVTRDSKGYQSPVHSSVLTWKKQPQMQLSSTGSEKREAISKMSQKKFRGGSSGLRANNYQHIYVDDAYGRMRSGLELTGSTATLYVDDKYKQMRSGLALTSSSAALYVEDRYRQMKSGLDLTSSSAALYVDDKYKQMKSGLDLTSSSAHLYVDDKYNQMKSGLALTSSSAALYVRSKTTKAELILSITNGKSNARLTADTIDIDGVVTELATHQIACTDITAGGGTFDSDVWIRDDAGLKVGDQTVVVANLEVSGNNLIITYTDGTTENFSKATTLSGTWASGVYTVSASPQGNTDYTSLTNTGHWGNPEHHIDGDESKPMENANTYYYKTYATRNGQATIYDTGNSTTIDGSGRYSAGESAGKNSGWNSCRSAMEIPTSDIGAVLDGNYATAKVKKPDANQASTKTDYNLTLNINDSFRPQGATADIKVAEIKYGSNVVARKTIGGSGSVSDFGIYDSNGTKRSGDINLGWNGSIDLWGGYTTDGTNWTWGDKVTVKGKALPSITDVDRKSTGITGTNAGDVSSKSGSYVTFKMAGYNYYIKIA